MWSPQPKNAKQALAKLKSDPDIEAVVLDIDMPHRDGLTTLSLLIDQYPKLQVIVASNLTLNHTEISMKALTLGACDYIVKPNAQEISADKGFKDELTNKIISHVLAKRGGRTK